MAEHGWYRWDRDLVQVSGPDTVAYLQGQLSQDIDRMAVGSTAWTLALQPQGKVASWLRITRVGADAYLCDVDGGHGTTLVDRLGRFKLRTKCEIELVPGWTVLAVRGTGVEVPSPEPGTWVLPFSWNGWVGFDVLGPVDSVGEPPAEPMGHDVFQESRIRARFPAMGAEIDGDTIPAEVGVVEESVSFTKGCYVGQELVARIDSRGASTPRRLRLVTAVNGELAAGDEIRVADAVVGRVTSGVRGFGLALVKRSVEPLTVGRTTVGVDVTIE